MYIYMTEMMADRLNFSKYTYINRVGVIRFQEIYSAIFSVFHGIYVAYVTDIIANILHSKPPQFRIWQAFNQHQNI